MANDIKPNVTLYMDIETGIEPVMSGIVRTMRDGVQVEVRQTFTIPTDNVKIGDTLIHRASNTTFIVTAIVPAGYVLKDIKDEIETTADIGLIKQSCWLMGEITETG